ncbi:(d)CMP kinase [Boudabousia marimammalium]|nr:(d)CMP kinase [Boudabousia marimammalium]
MLTENEPDFAGLVIAMDGPAGSGKSTVAKRVSDTLGLDYLDTGSMYRAATVRLQELGIDLHNSDACTAAVGKMRFAPAHDPYSGQILVDGKDVQSLIRTEEVSAVVSFVATNLAIRKIMVAAQQQIISDSVSQGRGIVAEGRDITTVVAPEAPVRVVVTASPETRLARRAGELGTSAQAESVRDAVLRRDRDDATVAQFEEPAEGVVLLDTTDLSIEEATAEIVKLAIVAKNDQLSD